MERIVYDVVIGWIVALISLFGNWQWPYIKSLFDAESRRQGRQVSGEWKAREEFADGTHDTFLIDLNCIGGRVTGSHKCEEGFDGRKRFDLEGKYKDHVLAFHWFPNELHGLESGTVTAKLLRDGYLEGHGLYIEPKDGQVYVSKYTAERVLNDK